MCSLNRIYYEKVCDDSYFRMRTENGFPETVPYKDKLQTNKPRIWKTHYLNILKYIYLLETKYNYEYRKEDKSPELLYLARFYQNINNHFTLNEDTKKEIKKFEHYCRCTKK